ncbi:heme A synthase [Lewinellaceae bacterium SD302]|nr:heme A synthase [Lewinellaceae bacterium SD302]
MERGRKDEISAHTNARQGGTYHAAVRWWLVAGLILVLGQVVIGGITRLTESGLSITEWKPLSGAVYPGSEAEWQLEFDKYQDSPQYEMIFADISMEDFKFIYFWEWFHRQWARMMGLVFAIGFAFFSYKGWLNKALNKRLGVVVLLAALAASFGWIMVASGLIERPWVNAYKLTMHLSIAFCVFAYLLWTTFKVWQPNIAGFPHQKLKSPVRVLLIVLVIQLILGGIMSGAKAALVYPDWPDMAGSFLPDVLLKSSNWTVENFVEYDQGPFLSALVQFLHRMTAYSLIIIGLWVSIRSFSQSISNSFRWANILLISMLGIQVILGIATVINSVGEVPVDLGVAHQGGAVFLLGFALYAAYHLWPGQPLRPVEKVVDNG